MIAVAGRDDEDWVAALGAAEVLPRDADLGAIDPVDGVFDAVPLGPAASTGALRDGGMAVFTRPPDPPESGARLGSSRSWCRPTRRAARPGGQARRRRAASTRVARALPLEEVVEGHRLAEAGGLEERWS